MLYRHRLSSANMDEVNQELFLQMLLKLDASHNSIKAASKWCRAHAQYHEDIVRMWFFAVAKATTMVRRLDLFHLASDILFTAEAQSMKYFSSFLPQLVKAIPLARGEEIKMNMKHLFALWRESKIYNIPVMDRLYKLLRNRNKVVDMNIFQYDRELLFKNLERVQHLKPACDYLMKGLESSPSFDDAQQLLSPVKEQGACSLLLSAVDNHKTKITSLVSYLEEMVHLLKMTISGLEVAGNREQNGIEEAKLKMVAYGRYNEKVLMLHRLESNYKIPRKVANAPMTPASTDPTDELSILFSQRANLSLLHPLAPPLVTMSSWNPQTTRVFSGAVPQGAGGFSGMVPQATRRFCNMVVKQEVPYEREGYRAITRELNPTVNPQATRVFSGVVVPPAASGYLGVVAPQTTGGFSDVKKEETFYEGEGYGAIAPTREQYPTAGLQAAAEGFLDVIAPQTTGGFSDVKKEETIYEGEGYGDGALTPTTELYPTAGSQAAGGFSNEVKPELSFKRKGYEATTQTRELYPSDLGSRVPTWYCYPTSHSSMTPTRNPYPAHRGSMTPARDDPPCYPVSSSYSESSSWGTPDNLPFSRRGRGPVYRK